MNHFHIWCDLQPGTKDRAFAAEAQEFLADLHARELCEGYNLTRRQFVLAPPALGRFHITVEFAGTAQMQRAFAFVEAAEGEAADSHRRLIAAIGSLTTALYRDYPERPKRQPRPPLA